jgi:collagen triple helix repeat protein
MEGMKAMLSRIRNHVTYLNIAMTLVLVFSLSGGAYAASKYLITSTKQISPKVLKSLKGKNGPAGPEGKLGASGPEGKTGAAGPAGKDGLPGTSGESVTSAALAKGDATCKEGGSKFTVGAKETFACNGKEGKEGKEGPQGEEGSPWTAGGTLPSGSTETGAWAAESNVGKVIHFTISFPIPLSAPITASANTVIVTRKQVEESKVPTGCKGSAAKPEASPGNLCVFEGGEEAPIAFSGISVFNQPSAGAGAGTTGSVFLSQTSEAGEFYQGTWAVTAP